MSVLAIVLICVGVLVLAVFVGGVLVSRRRLRAGAGVYAQHVAAADQALEAARAADKGWDRAVLERTAADALRSERPGWDYEGLHLILVDDRPGVAQDRAHFAALGEDGEVRVVLSRDDRGWAPERVE